MKWRELDPFLRAFWHRPADHLPCGNSPFAVSLFPLPWMIPDRSSPSWVRFAASRPGRLRSDPKDALLTRGKGGCGSGLRLTNHGKPGAFWFLIHRAAYQMGQTGHEPVSKRHRYFASSARGPAPMVAPQFSINRRSATQLFPLYHARAYCPKLLILFHLRPRTCVI